MELENDPANPCFGCGPEHPRGLRLAFAREGARVVARLDATHGLEGWPERLHSGLLYTAMLETANWAFFALRGRVGVPRATSHFAPRRFVRTGESLLLAGTLKDVTVTVEARDGAGGLVAALDRTYDVLDRAAFLQRMGYARMPAVFEDAFPA